MQTVLGFGCWGILQVRFNFSAQKCRTTSSQSTFHCRLKDHLQASLSRLYHTGRSLKSQILKDNFNNPVLPKDAYNTTIRPGRQVHTMTGKDGIFSQREWRNLNRFKTISELLKSSMICSLHPCQAVLALVGPNLWHGLHILILATMPTADGWFFFKIIAVSDPLLRKCWSSTRSMPQPLLWDWWILLFSFGTCLPPQYIIVDS